MNEEKSEPNLIQSLRKQLAIVEQLRDLPFDNPGYEEWRTKTGQILDHIFGQVQLEQHPCTKAFLSYRIPEHFTANRAEMQEFYRNIIEYQADLLRMYLEDFEDSNCLSITS